MLQINNSTIEANWHCNLSVWLVCYDLYWEDTKDK